MNRSLHEAGLEGAGGRWRTSFLSLFSSQRVGAAALSLGLLSGAAPVAATPTGSDAGSYDEGLELGHRNAGILFERLKLRTVDAQGCGAIGRLEAALVRVASSIRPPRGSSDALVRGFYRGYQEEIREELRRVRRGCGALRSSSGIFLGNYLGALTCSGAAQGVRIELVPFWEGWGEDPEAPLSECVESAREVLWSCENSVGGDGATFESSIEQACALSGGES